MILIATIPVSIAGWGVRESAMILAFSYAGLAESDGLIVSILFGVANLGSRRHRRHCLGCQRLSMAFGQDNRSRDAARTILRPDRFAVSVGRAAASRQEVGVGDGQTVVQPDLRRPAEPFDFRNVEKLLRRTVRSRGVERDLAVIADDLRDLGREVGDGDVLAGPDIEKGQIGVVLHQKHAGIGEIVGA